MSLARAFSDLGQLIIRQLGDTGGPRTDRVSAEFDNIIAGVNDIEDGTVRISNVSYCIHRDTAKTDSVGAGPDVLHTFSLPANSLATDGDYLDVFYAGSFATANRDRFVQAQFDGTSYENGGGFDFDAGTGWMLFNRIIRLSATTVRVSHTLMANLLTINSANTASSQNIGGFAITRNTASITVANLGSNAITMRVRSVVSSGVPAAADVFQNLSIIELCQQ